MKTKIFYFSGTGNSFFAAKKLHEYIENSEMLPMIKELKNPGINKDTEKIVLVFPVYALTIPLPVREFIKRYDFSGIRYFSAVATRLGIYFNDFKRINKLLKPNELNSHFILNMGNNDVKVKNYKCPSEKEIKELETNNVKKLRKISQIIISSTEWRKNDTNYLEPLPFGNIRNKAIGWLVPKLMTFSKLIGGVNYFYLNTKCTGCGICSTICLSGKISMKNKQPLWNRKTLCHMCYACINFCPARAIEIASIPGVPSYSHENERYSHPYAGYKEIQKQKE